VNCSQPFIKGVIERTLKLIYVAVFANTRKVGVRIKASHLTPRERRYNREWILLAKNELQKIRADEKTNS